MIRAFARHAATAMIAAALPALSAPPARAGSVLVAEPPLTMAQNFLVAADHGPPFGQFMVTQWQPNPLTADGLDVPVTQPMGRYTGLTPPPPLSLTQAGVSNLPGATGAQIDGRTIGISLNSDDFAVAGQVSPLVEIFPLFEYPSGTVVLPFAQAGKTLVLTMQTQVPTATLIPPASNPSYNGIADIGLDFNLQDTTHPASPPITMAGLAFTYGFGTPQSEFVKWLAAVKAIFVQTPLEPGMKFNTLPATSQRFQSQPWLGFRTFQFAFTQANLSNVIAAIRADTALLSSLGLTAADFSTNPANYALLGFHINSELAYAGTANQVYSGGTVRMGLALRNIQMSLQDANDCKSPHNGVDGTLGLENGDPRFLCSKTKWYDCTITRTWATSAATGQTVGPYQCTATGWVPAP